MSTRRSTTAVVAVGAALIAITGASIARSRRAPMLPVDAGERLPSADAAKDFAPAATPDLSIHVPRTDADLELDGELEEDAWLGAVGRSGPFTDSADTQARPYSDARFLWGKGNLYIGLYAADQNLLTLRDGHRDGGVDFDHFEVILGAGDGGVERRFSVDPNGRLQGDAPSGTHVGHDIDGTPNDERDEDEEWVIEMAVPLAALGLRGIAGERISLRVVRCDTPLSSTRTCGSWGDRRPGVLVLDDAKP